MLERKIFFFFLFCTCCSFAQDDTIQKRGTIKVGFHADSTYLRAVAKFVVYKLPADKRIVTYGDYVRSAPNNSAIQNSNRTIVKVAKPTMDSSEQFDYTSYFRNNEFTKGIKMRKGESDTVRLLVSINKKGDVRFSDSAPMEKKGGQLLVYDQKKKEYKIDAAHSKTQKAFEQLAKNKWQPAQILSLKTHPSKRKIKYIHTTGYTEGVLIIIYSSSPLEE